jgi:regulator of RNase E activity RraB
VRITFGIILLGAIAFDSRDYSCLVKLVGRLEIATGKLTNPELFMSKKRTQVVFDSWDTYVSQCDDGPLFISFDVEAAEKDLTHTLTHCARVIIPIHRPNKNGGPASPESEHLYDLEDELCTALVDHGVSCRLVGRLTCAGIRELVFQVDNWDSFRPPVGLLIMAHEDYEIDVSEHEGWTFFNDVIRPTADIWLMLADRRVIQGLLEAGSNPEKPHALEFVFNGDEEGLRQAARNLQKRGYVPLSPPDFSSGQVVMVKKMALDEEAILAESQAHKELAEEYGIEYDGWGAEVVR